MCLGAAAYLWVSRVVLQADQRPPSCQCSGLGSPAQMRLLKLQLHGLCQEQSRSGGAAQMRSGTESSRGAGLRINPTGATTDDGDGSGFSARGSGAEAIQTTELGSRAGAAPFAALQYTIAAMAVAPTGWQCQFVGKIHECSSADY